MNMKNIIIVSKVSLGVFSCSFYGFKIFFHSIVIIVWVGDISNYKVE
jgi:hypothetical protein